ncbi:MAG: NAD(P)H-binding protein [Marine Group I thaumarchaeote]|nr:MAG: NAD(P)H-binding protein [Marine Group I thaumarchaeote]
MSELSTQTKPYDILVTGASGFIGKKLLNQLTNSGFTVTAMSRSKYPDSEKIKRVQADAFDVDSLTKATEGITTAFYLLHSMEGSKKEWGEFANREKQQAQNFLKAATASGVKRIIYLGGLVNEGLELSKHMKSRHDVGKILASGNIPVTELRASVIVGAEGGSYAMLRYLVERLPLMVCPKWVKSQTQPIAVENVVDYLIGSMKNPETTGKILEIGGPDIMTYEQLMRLYSSILNRNLTVIQIPFLTPRLSSYWIDLVTPVKASLARPLVDSLVHDSVVKDDTAQKLIPIQLAHMTQAIQTAREEAKVFNSISKSEGEKTSYKMNQQILLITLCAMAFIGTTYYWLDDRSDVWQITWIVGSVIWYASILFAISFVRQKARLGYLIGGILAWVTLAFWLFDNFHVVFELSLVASEPSLEITIRNFIGAAIAGLAIFSSHNVFHKVRVYQARGKPVSESASSEVPEGARPVYNTDFS